MIPRDLSTKWRTDADVLDRYGDTRTATVLRDVADELERALRDVADEALTLAEAATASGYSTDRLRHMAAEGKLPNIGRPGAPRFRRGDLPTKKRAARGGFDAAAAARDLLTSRTG